MLHQQAGVGDALQPLVLADGDELHLRRDDAAPRVVHLRHVGARLGPTRRADVVEAQARRLRVVQPLAAVRRRRAGEQLGVAALLDPACAQRRQAAVEVAGGGRVGVGPRHVVHVDVRVGHVAVAGVGGALADLAERHADVRPAAFHIDFLAGREGLDGGVERLGGEVDVLVGCVHAGSLDAKGRLWNADRPRRQPELSAKRPSLRRYEPDQVPGVHLSPRRGRPQPVMLRITVCHPGTNCKLHTSVIRAARASV